MASPDLTPYVDLRLYDKDPQEIFDAALLELQYKVPEWEPREANTEVLLMESMALEVAESIFAINRLPGAVVEVLLKMYGIERYVGAAPTARIEFTVATTGGIELPAGIRVGLQLGDGFEPVIFTTSEPALVPAGSTVGYADAFGDRFTADANGSTAGTALELLDSIVYVETAKLAAEIVDGAEPETDEEWMDRGVARFARLTETLVLPDHFMQAALEEPELLRATAIDNYNPTAATAGAPGDHPGHMTVAVLGRLGLLTAAEKTAIRNDLDARAQANLSVHVVDPTITAVAVTATVRYEAGYEAVAVRLNVEEALKAYLSTSSWPWAKTVRRNELITLISNVEGVAFVDTLTAPSADVVLPGYAPLATTGTLTITMTAA